MSKPRNIVITLLPIAKGQESLAVRHLREEEARRIVERAINAYMYSL